MSGALGHTPDNHFTNRFPRTTGVVLLMVGAAMVKWQIYDPLHAAEEGKQEVWVSSQLVGLAIILSAYGSALITFGKKPNEWLKIDPKNVDWRNAVFLIGMAIICLGVYIWVAKELAAQGYK